MDKTYLTYSIKELRARGQQTAPNPEKETRVGKCTRIFSIYTTWLFLRTRCTPNQISVIGCVIYVAGLAVLFHESYLVTLLGPIFYFLSIVVDGSDGEVARIKRNGNRYGGPYVEPVTHDNLYTLTMLATGWGAYVGTGYSVYVVLGALGALGKIHFRLIRLRFWNIAYKGTEVATKEFQNAQSKKQSVFRRLFAWCHSSIYSYTGMFLPFTVAVIFQHLDYFVVFYSISFIGLYILLLFKHIYQIGKEKMA